MTAVWMNRSGLALPAGGVGPDFIAGDLLQVVGTLISAKAKP